jgi:hypothetical protein
MSSSSKHELVSMSMSLSELMMYPLPMGAEFSELELSDSLTFPFISGYKSSLKQV